MGRSGHGHGHLPCAPQCCKRAGSVKRRWYRVVRSGSQELGTGTYTIMTQVAADAVGFPIRQVHFDSVTPTFPKRRCREARKLRPVFHRP